MTNISRRLQEVSDPAVLAGAILQHSFVEGDPVVAAALAAVAKIVEVPRGAAIVRQGASDTDLYLIIAGRVAIVVNGREVALREAGQHFGEMTLIDTEARRSATVVAVEECVLARVSEADFSPIAHRHAFVWRSLARELVGRARLRFSLVSPRNEAPKLMVIASPASRGLANDLRECVAGDDLAVALWSRDSDEEAAITLDSLESVATDLDFAAFVIGPEDDLGRVAPEGFTLKEKLTFEFGVMIGKLGRERVFAAVPPGRERLVPRGLLETPPVILSPDREAVEAAGETLKLAILAVGSR
jgi:predicted nucleotide-binding protein